MTLGVIQRESEDELDFESDPLDREQEVDLASNMSPMIGHAREESMDGESINKDEFMSASTMASTTPFDPPHLAIL